MSSDSKDSNTSGASSGRHVPKDDPLVPTIGALGKKGEPISLAEEIALENSLGITIPEVDPALFAGDSSYWQELQQLSIEELITESRRYEEVESGMSDDRQELVFRIIKQRIRKSGLMFFEGAIEILPDEFGFLRSSESYYQSRPDDIYVSPSQVRRFSIRNGSIVSGQIRPPKMNEKYFALLRVEAINHRDPNKQKNMPHFEEMSATPSTVRIPIQREDFDDECAATTISALESIAYGQNAVLVGSSQQKNTRLMQSWVESALENDPKLSAFYVYIGETEQSLKAKRQILFRPHCDVVGTYTSETPFRHVQLTEFVLECAKRAVEYGKNVVICLDSASQLLNVLNSEHKSKFGGVDSRAWNHVQHLLHSAKKTETGSLTVLATVLSECEDPLDNLICNELKKISTLVVPN